MKKLILTFVLFSSLGLIYAQSCIPNTSITNSGYFPRILDSAQEMSAYNMTIQVRSQRDTMVSNPFGPGTINATIDSIIVTGVSGMPAGLNYICNPNNCRFVSLKTHCVNIYGMPAQGSAGIYPLSISVSVKVVVGGVIPQTINENINDFSIYVKDDNINSLANISNPQWLDVYPNPSNGKLNIANKNKVIGDLKIYDFQGKLILQQSLTAFSIQEIDIAMLPNGIYQAVVGFEHDYAAVKIIKQ